MKITYQENNYYFSATKIISKEFKFQVLIQTILELSIQLSLLILSGYPMNQILTDLQLPSYSPSCPFQSSLHIARIIFSKYEVDNLFHHFITLQWLFITYKIQISPYKTPSSMPPLCPTDLILYYSTFSLLATLVFILFYFFFFFL